MTKRAQLKMRQEKRFAELEFIIGLGTRSTLARQFIEDHYDAGKGSLIPYQFMEELYDHAIEIASSSDNLAELSGLFALIESNIGQDESIDALVEHSFLENIHYSHEANKFATEQIISLLGPKLLERLRSIEHHQPLFTSTNGS